MFGIRAAAEKAWLKRGGNIYFYEPLKERHDKYVENNFLAWL